MPNIEYLENRTFEEIEVGDSVRHERTLSEEDVRVFAAVSGDVNPAHLDPEYASHTMFKHVIAHGMWGGALISAVLGTALPGPGAIYVRQELRFRRPIYIGDHVAAVVTVREKQPERQHLVLDCACLVGEHTAVEGEAEVIAPPEKLRVPRAQLGEVHLTR